MKFINIDIDEAHENDYVVYKCGTRSLLDPDDIAHILKYGWPEAVKQRDVDHYERLVHDPQPGIFKNDGKYYAWDGRDAVQIASERFGVMGETEECSADTILSKGWEQTVCLPIRDKNL